LLTLIKRPRDFVEQAYTTFVSQEQHNTTEPFSLAFWNTRNRLVENMLAASGLTLDQVNKHPHKMILPGDSDLDTDELVATYLAGTPYAGKIQRSIQETVTGKFSAEIATKFASEMSVAGVVPTAKMSAELGWGCIWREISQRFL
jgi:hypothetical protein